MTRRDMAIGDESPAGCCSPSQFGVGVDFEYGDLKEAIVGIPSGAYPVISKADWLQELAKVLPREEFEKVNERSGKNNKDLPKYEQMEIENQELIVLLERQGVKVYRPDEVTEEQFAANFGAENLAICGFTQQYTRDPIVVIGNNVIELAASTPIRRADILGFKRLFQERLIGSNNRWYAMPVIDWSAMMNPKSGHDKTRMPVLEGGDVFVLGKKILVGTSLNNTVGSSELGYQWLRNMLEPQGYDVEQVPLSEEFLHLDCVLSTPREGLIILCTEGLAKKLPDFFKDWRVIEVSKEEAQHMATNGLPINPKHYVLPTNMFSRFEKVQEALEKEGITVHPIAFDNHTEDGGAIRCSLHPLVRQLS